MCYKITKRNPMQILSQKRLPVILLFSLIFLATSCTPAKHVIYFENLKKDTTLTDLVTKDFELKIQKGDILTITVVSSSAEENVKFNAPGLPGGYLVDSEGNIDFFKLGKVRAAGMTRKELKVSLERQLKDYLKDQIVTVRFSNHKIVVLGDVGAPHVVVMPEDKMTLLEALASSGDLTTSGRRDNILVIRDNGSDKEFKRINLNDNSVFSSRFYYLKPDDVVYVEPLKSKLKNSVQTQQVLSVVLSFVSIGLILLTQVFKL